MYLFRLTLICDQELIPAAPYPSLSHHDRSQGPTQAALCPLASPSYGHGQHDGGHRVFCRRDRRHERGPLCYDKIPAADPADHPYGVRCAFYLFSFLSSLYPTLINTSSCHFGNTDTCSDSTWYHRARGIYWESVLPIYDDFPGDVKIEIPVPDHMKAMKKKDDANKVVLV